MQAQCVQSGQQAYSLEDCYCLHTWEGRHGTLAGVWRRAPRLSFDQCRRLWGFSYLPAGSLAIQCRVCEGPLPTYSTCLA